MENVPNQGLNSLNLLAFKGMGMDLSLRPN